MVKMHNGKKVIALMGMILIIGIAFFSSVVSVNASVATKPSFTVSIDSVTPKLAIVGEDITIKGTITPESFEAEVPEREIIMVLDTSASMSETVRGEHNNTTDSTRIAELEKAAKAFVEKMKEVANLKISIVSYSSLATINPNGKDGNIIKDTVDNVFSIGYELGEDNSTENKMLKEIHKSMGGKDENFFVCDDGDIDSVFKQIAEEILTNTISNINIDIKLNPGFTLSTGGNMVELNNVNYKTQTKVSNGRVRYTADPIEFQFEIRANDDAQLGVNHLFNGATVTFPWSGENISINIPNTVIELKDNDLLKIKAELTSDKIVETNLGEEIDISYKVTAEDFIFNDTNNNKVKDVAVVVDVSKNMDLNNIKNSLFGKLIDNTISDQIKYSFITYSNNVKILNNLTANTNSNRNTLDQVIKNISNDASNEKNIGIAISKAVEVLNDTSKGASQDANKYIIFIGAGDQSYNTSDSAFIKVKNGDYNVITLTIQGQSNSLEVLHKKDLGKSESNFIVANDNNDIANNKMSVVADRVKNSGSNVSYKRDVQLEFELGDNFRQVIDGKIQDSNKIIIDLPTVIFKNNGNNLYHAEYVESVKFTVVAIGDSYGEYKFNKGIISYTNLANEKVSSSIETPLIKVIQSVKDIIHGIESLNKSGEKEFIEGSINIAENMQVNITAGAKISSNNINIKLCIDKIIDLNSYDNMSNIKVYKQINGELEEIQYSLEALGSNDSKNQYKININEVINEEINLVVKYLIEMKSGNGVKSYENNFIINGMEKSFILHETTLPKLF